MNDATKKSRESRTGSSEKSSPRPPRAGFGARSSRSSRAESREAVRGTSPRFGNEKPRPHSDANSDRPPHKEAGLGPVRDLDEDILRLVARRAKLLSKMPETGKAARERELRTHWEEQACRLSRDPRLIRQLFALLQEVEIADEDLAGNAFNLAPSAQPVDIDLALPSSCRQNRIFVTLAAASGQPLTLDGIVLNAPLVECVKAMNQAGATLRWEEFPEPVITASGGTGISGAGHPVLDRVIHVGDNAFTLYLLLFQLVTRQTRVKIIGDSTLRFLNLTAVRHFMPALGCRLSAMVPGQDGLPVRLESSALLPESVNVPADLPPDAVTALLLAAPFWDKNVTFNLDVHAKGRAILDEISVYFNQCGCAFTRSGLHLTVTPGSISLPTAPAPEMTPPLAYALLALPALSGGRTILRGNWPSTFPGNDAAKSLLASAVKLTIKDGLCESRPLEKPASQWDFSALPANLLGLGLALFVRAAAAQAAPELPPLPQDTAMDMIDDFLLHLGFARNGMKLEAAPEVRSAWAAPDAWWGIAYALGSFTRRNIRLSNPNVVTGLAPQFWTVFNSLPAPVLAKAPEPVEAAAPSPARRRFRSNEFLTGEELPPALDLADED